MIMKRATEGHIPALSGGGFLQALHGWREGFRGYFTPLPKQKIVIGKFGVKAMPLHSARRDNFHAACGLGLPLAISSESARP